MVTQPVTPADHSFPSHSGAMDTFALMVLPSLSAFPEGQGHGPTKISCLSLQPKPLWCPTWSPSLCQALGCRLIVFNCVFLSSVPSLPPGCVFEITLCSMPCSYKLAHFQVLLPGLSLGWEKNGEREKAAREASLVAQG